MFLRNNCAVEVLSTSPVCRHGCRISLVPGLGMDGSQVLVCWLAGGRCNILLLWIAWPSLLWLRSSRAALDVEGLSVASRLKTLVHHA